MGLQVVLRGFQGGRPTRKISFEIRWWSGWHYFGIITIWGFSENLAQGGIGAEAKPDPEEKPANKPSYLNL
jgi:hypothetical protein